MPSTEPHDQPMWSSISKDDIDRIQSELVAERAQVARRAKIVAFAAVTTGLATAMFSFFTTEKDQRIARLVGLPVPSHNRGAELADIERRIAAAEDALKRLQRQPSVNEGKSPVPVDKLLTLQDAQAKRLSALEAAIMSSPENAISVPLIKRDLEALRSENQAQIAFLRTDIDRVFSVGTWVLTGLFTVIAAIASWVLTTLFPGKEKKQS